MLGSTYTSLSEREREPRVVFNPKVELFRNTTRVPALVCQSKAGTPARLSPALTKTHLLLLLLLLRPHNVYVYF